MASFLGKFWPFKNKPKPEPEIEVGGGEHAAEALATPEDEVLYAGDWFYATSSNVNRWRYLHDDQTLEVHYMHGGAYQYLGVPLDVVRRFLKTDSPGRFVHWHLNRAYPHIQIEPNSTAQGRPRVVRTVHPPRRFRD